MAMIIPKLKKGLNLSRHLIRALFQALLDYNPIESYLLIKFN